MTHRESTHNPPTNTTQVALLSEEDDGLRWRAADLLGNLTQNNVTCQDLALQFRVLDRLMPLLEPANAANVSEGRHIEQPV